jgi:hypothetical protein
MQAAEIDLSSLKMEYEAYEDDEYKLKRCIRQFTII